jgi:hypothetical protein
MEDTANSCNLREAYPLPPVGKTHSKQQLGQSQPAVCVAYTAPWLVGNQHRKQDRQFKKNFSHFQKRKFPSMRSAKLRRLVANFPLRNQGSISASGNVDFAVDEVALERDFHAVPLFPLPILIPTIAPHSFIILL